MNVKGRLVAVLIVSIAFSQKCWSASLELNTPADVMARSHNEQGISFANKGAHDRAIAEFNKALALSPDFVRPFFNRGLMYLRMGYDQAITDFDKVIEIITKNSGARVIREATYVPKEQYAQVYFNRGTARLEKADYDLAIADFTKALEINPRLSMAFNNRAAAHLEKGQFDQAKSDLDRALQLNSKYALAYMNRGIMYYRQGDNDLAIKNYTEAIQLDSKLAIAHANRGRAFAKKRQFDQALANFNTALEINPNAATAYHGLAMLFTVEGKYAEAEPLFKKALAMFEKIQGPAHPHVAEVLEHYAAMLRKVGRESEAAEMESRVKAMRVLRGEN